MYYRRKIELALLQVFGGELGKTKFQKLLFLFTRKQKKSAYDFVPYKFGCFSFQSNADMMTLAKYGMVTETAEKESWQKTDEEDYLSMIDRADRVSLCLLKNRFESFSTKDLVKHVYQNFPYYAINSSIAVSILTETEFRNVQDATPTSAKTGLYSIGYEGISLEAYLNRLIEHDIKVLCDVRKNSFSMKYGFSKSQLHNACNGVGIEFIHMPKMGIKSDKRKKLVTQSDYDTLFTEYCATTLEEEKEGIEEIAELVRLHKRVAITCFEANIHQCHRKHLANKVTGLPSWNYEMQHL